MHIALEACYLVHVRVHVHVQVIERTLLGWSSRTRSDRLVRVCLRHCVFDACVSVQGVEGE